MILTQTQAAKMILQIGMLFLIPYLLNPNPAFSVTDINVIRQKFQSIDQDGDGNIRQDELDGFAQTKLAEMDQNNDGFVTGADYRAFISKRYKYKYTQLQLNYVGGQFIGAYDRDFDKKVDLEEYKKLLTGIVFRWDRNSDRTVTYPEFLSQLGNIHAECMCADY